MKGWKTFSFAYASTLCERELLDFGVDMFVRYGGAMVDMRGCAVHRARFLAWVC